ncbi:hypothetical protein [Aliiroseovarius subalbicans]|uniref:hypothetical protein n=1 Tax=Aliiroseovarius subalbicans TaxID=2925840 RepID=UPI001F573A1C|nr:hypothetical protein [Aliiroseovarius subalbicans]MCI2398995.1 hypothetical protein [Aliiroseovarius subalbicans]
MAFEEMKAAVAAILDEIAKRPQDRHVLQEQLRAKIAEFEAMGLPIPGDLKVFEEDLEDDDADDLFDNMPV